MNQGKENSGAKTPVNREEGHPDPALNRKDKLVSYFKKLGWLGFFFFLGKGLLWIIVPYLAAKGFINCNGD